MRYEEFIGRIQERAALGGRQAAEQTARATLETLAERIPGGVADHLAAQLPHEAAESLRRVVALHETAPHERAESRVHGERFDLPVFAGRVAWRDGTSEEEAIRRVSAVLEVLDAAVDPELIRKLEHFLPPRLRAVLPSARADA
jgi:uncharacterized protein (DUF2267 family)